MAIAIVFPGFNDLGRSVNPIFCADFLRLAKIYRLEV